LSNCQFSSRSLYLVNQLSKIESWFINLEQTPLNRSQQLPAPYKRLKKSGNKCTLVQRLRDASVSEKLGSQTIETDTTFSQIESPANGQDNPRVDDIYSFIEIKVKEVCRLEIEKLKQEASTS